MRFDPTLYVITDSTYHTTETLLRAVDEACRGGATLIQLREKDTGGRSYLELGAAGQVRHRPLQRAAHHRRPRGCCHCLRCGRRTCRRERPGRWRSAAGCSARIRSSARPPKTVEAAVAAYNDGADYLGTGAIYPTTTHVTTKVTPVSVLNDVCRAVPIPGGCHRRPTRINMDVLADSPIKGIAVVSAVMKADDPCAAAAHIKEKFLKMMNK